MSRGKMKKSDNFLTIVDRIKQIKNLHSDTKVAELLGMSITALANRKYRDSIPYQELILFCESENISLKWLLAGEGDKKKANIMNPESAQSSPTQQLLVETISSLSPERQKTVLRLAIEQEELQRTEKQQREAVKKVNAAPKKSGSRGGQSVG